MKLKAKLPLVIRTGTYVEGPDGWKLVPSKDNKTIIIHGSGEKANE